MNEWSEKSIGGLAYTEILYIETYMHVKYSSVNLYEVSTAAVSL
jgi:hypothetical protein